MPDYVDFKKRITRGDLLYRPLRTNAKGGKSGHVSLKGTDGTSQDMVVQTSKERAPWACSSMTGDDGKEKWSLDVAVSDPDLQTWFNSLDDDILAEAVANSIEWFGKELSLDVIKEFYRPVLKQPRDPRYNPTLSIKLPQRGDKVEAEFFDEDYQKITAADISPGCHVVSIIRPRGLYFIGKRNFGFTFELVMAKVYNPGKIKGYSFKGLEEDAELPINGVTGLPEVPTTKKRKMTFEDDAPSAKKTAVEGTTVKATTVEELFN